MQLPDWLDKWHRQHGEGRCVNCGFLCKGTGDLFNTRHQDLESPTLGQREAGMLLQRRDGSACAPMCFVGAHLLEMDLMSEVVGHEIAAVPERPPTNSDVHAVLTADRHCQQWIRLRPGLGPREHLDLWHMFEIERRREEFDAKLERERQEFEARTIQQQREFEQWMFEKGQATQQVAVELADKNLKIASRNLWVSVAGIVIAALVAFIVARSSPEPAVTVAPVFMVPTQATAVVPPTAQPAGPEPTS